MNTVGCLFILCFSADFRRVLLLFFFFHFSFFIFRSFHSVSLVLVIDSTTSCVAVFVIFPLVRLLTKEKNHICTKWCSYTSLQYSLNIYGIFNAPVPLCSLYFGVDNDAKLSTASDAVYVNYFFFFILKSHMYRFMFMNFERTMILIQFGEWDFSFSSYDTLV